MLGNILLIIFLLVLLLLITFDTSSPLAPYTGHTNIILYSIL
jgi:hypothetical protein